MTFDYENYMKVMEVFMLQLEQLTDIDSPQLKEALGDVCRFLKVGRLEACFYGENFKDSGEEKCMVHYSLEKEAYDVENVFTIEENVDKESHALYRFYPIVGEAAWSEVEIEKINILEKMLYSFYLRFQAMSAAEKMKFRDQQFPVWNISYFNKLVAKQIDAGRIEKYAACYFNLKGFSTVNQAIGRANGTKAMINFIKNLEEELTEDECICRIGGDNFIILFYIEKLDFVMEYLQGIDIFYDEKEEKKVTVSASAGYYVVTAEDAVQQPNDIIDKISAALNIARNVEKLPYVFYNETMKKHINNVKQVEGSFLKALENEEFLVYYQPKVDLKDYRLAGAEALCRWMKDGQLIPPDSFIPILEQSRAICKLDFYVLEHVCRDMRRWMQEGKELVRISVNLSRRHLEDDNLLEHLFSIIDEYQIPHQYLEIELTETTIDVEFQDLKRIVNGLQNKGISTSVDDFGVGYSSLNLIEEMSWNILKVDKSFLPQQERKNARKSVMLKYIIALAQNLGLECIAEGVENIEQVRMLKENNCYLAQGFYFDRPLPVAEFEKKLRKTGA